MLTFLQLISELSRVFQSLTPVTMMIFVFKMLITLQIRSSSKKRRSYVVTVGKKKKKKNLFLFDHFVNTIHTYTLSMSYIYNLNNTNMKILANMVIMRINNNKSRVRRLL